MLEIKHRSTGTNPDYRAAKDALDRNAQKGKCRICGADLPQGQRKYCSRDCFLGWFQQFNPPFIWREFRQKAFERDNYTCVKCGKKDQDWNRGDHLVADHIVPIALGGEEFDLNNVQTLCLDCNRTKTRKDAQKIAALRSDIKMGRVHNDHRWPK